MCENLMEVQELHYKYEDGTHALKGVDIQIRKGRTTAIVGGNGAGKSTFFLSLNGIYKPHSGKIMFRGNPIDYSRKGINELRRLVGIVFQDPDKQLFSSSVYKDVSFGLMNLKLTEEEIRKRVDNALFKTGITDIKHKPTHSLSYGQKKRVAMAGVLVMEPELVVLDEPTAGLDPLGVVEIMKLLKENKEQLGLTIVMATHDIDIVPIYCDYVYVLEDGKVIIEGTPKKIFSKPDLLRNAGLRLPRIAHLMEILNKKDGFGLDNIGITISNARKVFNNWKGKI